MSAGARFLPSTVRIGLYNLQGLEEKCSEVHFFLARILEVFLGAYIEVCKNRTRGQSCMYYFHVSIHFGYSRYLPAPGFPGFSA